MLRGYWNPLRPFVSSFSTNYPSSLHVTTLPRSHPSTDLAFSQRVTIRPRVVFQEKTNKWIKKRSCWFAFRCFIIVPTKSLDFYSDSGKAFELIMSPSPQFPPEFPLASLLVNWALFFSLHPYSREEDVCFPSQFYRKKVRVTSKKRSFCAALVGRYMRYLLVKQFPTMEVLT